MAADSSRFPALSLPLMPALAATAAPDLVIRRARIMDGTGRPAYEGDIAVSGGRVAAIGALPGSAADEIDAAGLVAAPGFVDVHTHSEGLVRAPRAEGFARMGVTTVVSGNCGGSRLDVGAFLAEAEAAGVSINVATLVGHGTVRARAMGGAFDRPPTPDELAKMEDLVAEAMAAGALGLSTGLIYAPGTFAKTEEIIAVAKVAATHGGLYATHMRNEETGILDSIGEVVRVAREAGIRAEIAHLKLHGKTAWGRSPEVLEALGRARAEGLRITHDMYLYTASSTSITARLIPDDALDGGTEKLLQRLADPARAAAIARVMRAELADRGFDDYSYVAITSCARNPALNGLRIPEAARATRGSASLDDQIETVLQIVRDGGAGAIYHAMSEEDLQTFLRDPHTLIASDGSPGGAHPRSCGNNARALGRYARDLKLLPLEEMVRKMTSLPATTFGLKDRGVLRPGAAADIVLFDPDRVRDTATYQEPRRHPEGIPHVIVNGAPVIRDGEHTGAPAGRALGRQAPAA
ncbi:MAG: D-aminoacylase [Armatimonadetes bacterium]|nr:D-aminoacylase [Armatimonadota bacterium]